MQTERGDDAIGNKEGRLQDMETVKEYLKILKGNEETKYMALPFHNIFQDMGWLSNNMNMVSVQMADTLKKADTLPESREKDIALSALEEAAEGILAARKFHLRAESMILKGVEVSVKGFQCSGKQVSEKPFPILKTEKELEGMMKALVKPFAAIDKAIGKIEDEKGLLCKDGHYRDAASGCCLGDGDRKLEMVAVLWPMRTTQKLIRQTHDAAHDAASRIDDIRPKARRIIKKDTLETGIFWEKEKLKMESETKLPEMPLKAQIVRVSLRKRLETAKTDCNRSYVSAHEKERTVAEMDR